MLRYIDMYNRTIPVTYNWKSILDQNQTSDLKFERTGTCLFALLLLYFFCILSCLLLYNYRRDCNLELLWVLWVSRFTNSNRCVQFYTNWYCPGWVVCTHVWCCSNSDSEVTDNSIDCGCSCNHEKVLWEEVVCDLLNSQHGGPFFAWCLPLDLSSKDGPTSCTKPQGPISSWLLSRPKNIIWNLFLYTV